MPYDEEVAFNLPDSVKILR